TAHGQIRIRIRISVRPPSAVSRQPPLRSVGPGPTSSTLHHKIRLLPVPEHGGEAPTRHRQVRATVAAGRMGPHPAAGFGPAVAAGMGAKMAVELRLLPLARAFVLADGEQHPATITLRNPFELLLL